MILDKGNDQYLEISLKTVNNSSDHPAMKNATMTSFLNEFKDSLSSPVSVKDIFDEILDFCESNQPNKDLLSIDEINALRKIESSKPLNISRYINDNPELTYKFTLLSYNSIRYFVINRLFEIIQSIPIEELVKYFIQIPSADSDFIVITAHGRKDGGVSISKLQNLDCSNADLSLERFNIVIDGIELDR